MGERKKIGEVLADNVKRLKDKTGVRSLGASPKTINNVLNARHQVQLDTLAAIAKALKVEPYSLLVPMDDEKFLGVILAWGQSDSRGRDDLHAIAEAILKRRDAIDDKGASSPTTALRRRANTG